jgi:hypothetical protein
MELGNVNCTNRKRSCVERWCMMEGDVLLLGWQIWRGLWTARDATVPHIQCMRAKVGYVDLLSIICITQLGRTVGEYKQRVEKE